MTMDLAAWAAHIDCLFDADVFGWRRLPGACPDDAIALAGHDYDDVDRMFIDSDTGGGE